MSLSAAGFLLCSCASVCLAADQIRRQRAELETRWCRWQCIVQWAVWRRFYLCCFHPVLLIAHLQPSAANDTRWRCLFLVGSFTSYMHINTEGKKSCTLKSRYWYSYAIKHPHTQLTDKCSCLRCWLLLVFKQHRFSCIDFWMGLWLGYACHFFQFLFKQSTV